MASRSKSGNEAGSKNKAHLKIKSAANTMPSGSVNCPRCGIPHYVALDTAEFDCRECSCRIIIGKKVLPPSGNRHD